MHESERLNGWKEIAAFLGKGVRTAQRWERVFGMPVHRLGHRGGEIVFARRDEISCWLQTARFDREANGESGVAEGDARGVARTVVADATLESEVPPPAALLRRSRIGFVAWGLLAAVVVPLALVWTWRVLALLPRADAAAARSPASWKTSGDRLRVFDTAGALLWEHAFGVDLNDYSVFSRADSQGRVVQPAVQRDLDGDGAIETLFMLSFRGGTAQALHMFDSDGSVRFVDRPRDTVSFGGVAYGPPWSNYRIHVGLPRADGTPRIWHVAIHGIWFPTRLRQLDAQGRLVSEYWSNGYIESVGEDTWQAQPVLFANGTNNEFRGASLAIFEIDRVTGSAPAVNRKYACQDCPGGGPSAFLVFPRSCLEKPTSAGQPFVANTWTEGEAALKVRVRHIFKYPPPGERYAWGEVLYTFDRGYRLVSVDVTQDYRDVHARLVEQGLLDHPFGPGDERELGQVTRWNGTAFEPVPRTRSGAGERLAPSVQGRSLTGGAARQRAGGGRLEEGARGADPAHPAGPSQSGPGVTLGRRYEFPANEEHIESIAFESGGDGTPTLVTRVGGTEQRLAVPFGRWATMRLPERLPVREQQVAASGAGVDDHTLAVTLAYYETPFKLNARLTFAGDTVTYEREMHVAFGETRRPTLTGRAR